MKHSPAPWSVHPYRDGKLHEVKSSNGDFKSASISIGSGEVLIGEFNHFDNAAGYPSPTLEEMHANARLAIAAPELLEALEEVLEFVFSPELEVGFEGCEAIEKAKQAVKKAKELNA